MCECETDIVVASLSLDCSAKGQVLECRKEGAARGQLSINYINFNVDVKESQLDKH